MCKQSSAKTPRNDGVSSLSIPARIKGILKNYPLVLGRLLHLSAGSFSAKFTYARREKDVWNEPNWSSSFQLVADGCTSDFATFVRVERIFDSLLHSVLCLPNCGPLKCCKLRLSSVLVWTFSLKNLKLALGYSWNIHRCLLTSAL